MLQIILAVIGISIISVMGFVTLEHLHLREQLQVQSENMKRLDVAAEGLSGALGRIPGVEGLLAPAPGPTANGWSTLPEGVGAINSTVSGVPFLYCPVAPPSEATELASLPSQLTGTVEMPGGNYAIGTLGGFVASSGLGISSEIASLEPVAFIVAPGANSAAPPSCEGITLENGRAVVDGGIVRVVSMPAGVGSMSGGGNSAAEFFVSATGNGTGKAGSPTSIDAALRHFVRYMPDTMTVHLAGSVNPSSAVWGDFLAASASSGAKLRIVGYPNNGADVLDAPSGVWNVPSSTFFENVIVKGPQVVAAAGDTIFNLGSVQYEPAGSPPSTVQVLAGGRFVASDSGVFFANPGQIGLHVFGQADIRGSTLLSGSGQLSSFIWLDEGADLEVVGSDIGATGNRPVNSAIVSAGADQIASDSASRAFASTVSSGCWAWSGGDLAFKWSNTGVGSRSGVRPETDFPAPAPEADPADLQVYQEGVNERLRARRVNASNLLCS